MSELKWNYMSTKGNFSKGACVHIAHVCASFALLFSCVARLHLRELDFKPAHLNALN